MDVIQCAGGIVTRPVDGGFETLLIRHAMGGLILIKGRVEVGESNAEAALREADEEAGLRGATTGRYFGSLTRSSDGMPGTTKEVHVFEFVGGAIHSEFAHEPCEWHACAEALKQMRYPEERGLLRRALLQLGVGV